MNKALAISLFFLFALRPAYNVGYVLYYELNIDYIIETYCVNKEKPKLECNGKCHLMKQLNVGASTSENPSTFRMVEAFFPLYYQEINDSNSLRVFEVFQDTPTYYWEFFPEKRVTSIDHPPQV